MEQTPFGFASFDYSQDRQGGLVCSYDRNTAIQACRGDWGDG